MEDETCDHCRHTSQMWQERNFAAMALRFIAVSTPLILGIAMFVVAVRA